MHALLLLLLVQDTRHVVEPTIPKSCVVLTSQRDAIDDDKPDTARIQVALDKCQSGQAVELSGKIFLAGPLQLRAGVTLLVDKGAALYGSRNPRDYDLSPGSCGIVDAGAQAFGAEPAEHHRVDGADSDSPRVRNPEGDRSPGCGRSSAEGCGAASGGGDVLPADAACVACLSDEVA